MFLRDKNNTEEAQARILETAQRIDSLRASLGASPSPADARARLDLAHILCWQGHFQPAADLAKPLAGPSCEASLLMEAQQLLGDNFYRHEQYDLASRQYHQNLEVARAAGEEYWCCRAQDGIAWVLVDVGHYKSGEFEEAERIFLDLRPRHHQAGRWGEEAMAIYGLSRAAAGTGNYERAIELANESISVLEANDGRFLLQLPLLQLGNVYRDYGDFDRSRPFYDAAIDAADWSQDPYIQCLTALHHGILLQFTGDLGGAVSQWKAVLPLIKELDFPRLGHETTSRLATVAARASDFQEAYSRHIESQDYGNRVGVISPILHNQQMLLRDQMDRTAHLEDALAFLRAGVEASVDGIFVLGKPDSGIDERDFVIRFTNAAAARMFGKTPHDIHQVLLDSVWKSRSAALLVDASLEVIEKGERRSLDPVELELLPGDSRWYSVKIAPIPDGVAWTLSDVTDREAMQREIVAQRDSLERANSRLKVLDREKTETLGIAAHDLRSPIANIRSICELISPSDLESQELVGTIQEISDSLLALIGNLLDVERIDRGELRLVLEPTDISVPLTQVVEEFSAAAAQKNIRIALSMPLTSCPILADESALRRVLQNLISNALKFSPAGSTVSLNASYDEERTRIEVKDQGPGISETDRQKLFAKFARLSARPTAGESSTGLGLSIVKRLVESMDGQVGCDSEYGKGATFWIEFEAFEQAASAA